MRLHAAVIVLLSLLAVHAMPQTANAQITLGSPAPAFSKSLLGGGTYTFTPVSSKVRVLFLFGYNCPVCLADGPSVQQQLHQYYASVSPGEVEVIGVDVWNGPASGVNNFKNSTGATYPLLLNGAVATGGNVEALYGPWDNFLVISKQGIVRYHSALTYPHGNRFHLNEIRATVDSLVAGFVDVPPAGPASLSLSAGPNPMRVEARVALTLPRGGEATRVSVHDLSGRSIAVLHDGIASAGLLSLQWDGRDARGSLAPAGLYLVRARVGDEVLSRRLAVVR